MAPRKYTSETEKKFLLLLTTVFVFLTIFILKDIFALIIYSFILAYFLKPIYNKLLEKTDSARISALITIFSSIIFIFTPLILIIYFIVLELSTLILNYKEYIENPELINIVVSSFIEQTTNSTTLSSIDFSAIVNKLVVLIVNFTQNFFSSLPKTAIYFFITLFITYYVLIHNKEIIKALHEYLPLSPKKQNKILKNMAKNTHVLFKGYFLTALIQTAVALAGYLLFDAPNILIITFLTLIASIIPYIGTPIVWVPVSIYMMLTGQEFQGTILLIYGTLLINSIDNFVRPMLMSDKDTIPPALVFIGFMGGMLAFGLVGLILGPIIISLTSISLKFINEEFKSEIKE